MAKKKKKKAKKMVKKQEKMIKKIEKLVSSENLEEEVIKEKEIVEKLEKEVEKKAEEVAKIERGEKRAIRRVELNVRTRARLKLVYALFFLIGIALSIASIMTKEWFSFGVAIVVMLLSLIIYWIGRKIGLYASFRIYLLVWVVSLALGIFSILDSKYFSVAIAGVSMFFCSYMARMAKKYLKEEIIAEEIRRIRKKAKRYETGFDEIIILLKKYKDIKISQLYKGFNVNREKVEEWAQILEDHGLLEMHYPPFSEVVLRLKKKIQKKEEE